MMRVGLTRLFHDAMIISLPILGTLFLTSLTTGLISKPLRRSTSSPKVSQFQSVAFLLLWASLPFMVDAFSNMIDSGFRNIETLYTQIGRQITGVVQ